MSDVRQSNAVAIIAVYQARDLDTVLELTSDGSVFVNNAKPGITPYCANVSNKEEFAAYLSEIDECWQIEWFQIDHLVANGNEVATRSLMDCVSKKSRKRVITQRANFWTVSDGKIVKILEFYDTAALGACV
ncbi:MAG: nuclear transport factor 2 family protein [Paracoccaceae bacterium]